MIILFILIIAGLAGIALIILPKFSLLARLDTTALPPEQEARKKREILFRRIETEGEAMRQRWRQRWKPLKRWWGRVQLSFRIYVGKIERLWRHEQVAARKSFSSSTPRGAEQETRLDKHLKAGQSHLSQENFEQAEESFIAAVKLDKRSVPAYAGLAEVYQLKGSLSEAAEIYEFLLQLQPDNDIFYLKLGEIAEAQGKLEHAIHRYQQAIVLNDALSPRFYHLAELLLKIDQPTVAYEAIRSAIDLEPKNPKYLDLLIEIGILCNDKELANQAYQELRSVNPDNQKLVGFRERIDKL